MGPLQIMRKIFRLIFRLDYPLNYGIIDGGGQALSVLRSGREQFWDNVGMSPQHKSFTVSSSSSTAYSDMTVEPTNINGSFEISDGVDLDGIQDHETFGLFDTVLTDFCQRFEIEDLDRCGLRIVCLASFSDAPVGSLEVYRRAFFRAEALDPVEASVADQSITDLAIVLNGKAQDGVEYRITFGPHKETDLDRFLFQHLRPSDEQKALFGGYHLAADIDFFERNFSFRGLTLSRWSRTKWPLSRGLIDTLSERLRGEIAE